MATFIRLRTDLERTLSTYLHDATRERANYINTLIEQLVSLIDLSALPHAIRRDSGRETVTYLLDILGRVELPDLESIPDTTSISGKDEAARWRVPETPIYIARLNEGSREGEFLFSERTVRVARRFYRAIKTVPLHSSLGIKSWHTELLQSTGPMIPSAFVRALPDGLKVTWYGTPIWKVLVVALLSLLAGLFIALVHRFVSMKATDTTIRSHCWRLLRPVSIMVCVWFLGSFIDFELIVSGAFSRAVNFLEILFFHFALAWIFWIAIRATFEWLILSPSIPDESLDANLLRLMAVFIGIVGVVIIISIAGERLGLPALSLLAGLGIGGIAVALAIRPTLENLIGGVILYIDKPVRVGDLCSFGDRMAWVENIGVRSTQLRGLDRTLISVPNAQFVDMELVNWARCNEMLIEETLGLRYETSAEQLRYVLTKLREMLHAHPRINNDTIRVRFSGYGESSLNVTVRIYAKTRELNELHAIREDVLLRAYDVVTEAGTSFAFPSRTVYMGQDAGLDKKRATAAEKQVEAWRKSGELPFPGLPADRRQEIEDTLDYPPHGSPEANIKQKQEIDTTDPSAESLSAEDDLEKKDRKTPPNG